MNLSDATDIRYNGSTVDSVWFRGSLIWPKTPPVPPTPTDWSTEYLQVEALEQLQLRNYIDTQSFDATAVYYSTNKADWYNWNKNIAVSLNTGDKVYFKGYYKASNSDVNLRQMPIAYSQGRHKVQGNIMSLLYMDNFSDKTTLNFDLSGNRIVGGATKCFNTLFQHDIGLVDASNLVLPAIRLANACYAYMFENCYNLIYSPSVLPATELSHYSGGYIVDPGDNCYWGMFYNCTSLLSTPSLPATSLASGCYKRMFAGCSALTTTPSLPAMNLASECYYQMFAGCHTLTTAPSLPARILSSSCYYGMFHLCDALTTAPSLPATTLVSNCYNSMFYNCQSLNYIECLATNMSATDCLNNWTYNVDSSGTFIKDPNATWISGSSGIPLGWTVLPIVLDDFYAFDPDLQEPISNVDVECYQGSPVELDYEYVGEISGEVTEDSKLNADEVTWTCDNEFVWLDYFDYPENMWYITINDDSQSGSATLTLSINSDAPYVHAPVTYNLSWYLLDDSPIPDE